MAESAAERMVPFVEDNRLARRARRIARCFLGRGQVWGLRGSWGEEKVMSVVGWLWDCSGDG